MMTVSFGVGAFLIPIGMSAIYKAINFRSTMDVLGVLVSVNAVAFTIHASRNSCGRKPEQLKSEEEDDPLILE